MTPQQLHKYFERIGFDGNIDSPTLDALITLQRKHAHTFPFENINPLLNIDIELDFQSLFTKFVINGRGGYCFEQNFLFMNILQYLGYDARAITGRVYTDGTQLRSRSHMLTLVSINGIEYICDVGFGSLASIKPIEIKEGIEQKVDHDIYKIDNTKEGFILKIKLKGKWRSLYLFDLQLQHFEDLEMGNWYTSTHPESHFKHHLFLAIKDDDNTYNLDDNIFTTFHLGDIVERIEITTLHEFRDIITNVFKIRLDNLDGIDDKLNSFL